MIKINRIAATIFSCLFFFNLALPICLGFSDSFIIQQQVICPGQDCSSGGQIGESSGSGATGNTGSGETDTGTEINNGDNTSGGPVDPFDRLPARFSDEEKLRRLTLASFSFIQLGEGVKLFNDQGLVRINGRKHLTVALDYDQVPEVLKTIGMTIIDSEDPNRAVSFVLKVDEESQAYTATIAPLGRSGIYPFHIHILDYRNQRVKKMSGFMQVSGIGFLPDTSIALLNRFLRPLALTTGVLAGASPLIALGSIGSFYDIYLLLARSIGALLGALGFRRKRKPWGTVYDSVTKRPLDPAYVSVFQNGQEIASAITDIDGRYGFLVPPGSYDLKVSKSHYQFPSQFLAGKKEDEFYDSLYFGGPITTTGTEALTLNIPMDPVAFDWNEFAKREGDFNHLRFEKELITSRGLKIFYIVGFILALGSVIASPSIFNLGVLALYILLYTFRSLHARSRKLVTIKQQITNEPLPYILVRVWLAGVNQEVKKLVADQLGRIYFLVQPGDYYLTLEKKNPDGSYYVFYKTEVLHLKHGVLTKDIEIPRFKFTD